MEVDIPESVKRYLLKDEQVIGWTYSSDFTGYRGGADFYATNKRLIKRQRSIIGEWLFSFDFRARFSGVELHRITSITFHRYRPRSSLIAGILFFLSFLSFSILFFSLPPPSEYSGPNPITAWGVCFLVLGLFLAGLFCSIKISYFQVNIRNSNKKELKEWRIILPRWKGKKKRDFVLKIESFVSMIQNKIDRGRPRRNQQFESDNL